MVEHILFQINARRHFNHLEPFFVHFKDRALCDKQGFAPLRGCKGGIVANLLDRMHELAMASLGDDLQSAVPAFDLQTTGGKGAAEHDFAGVLTDIDEAANADNFISEPADIDIAFGINLGKGQKGNIQSTAIIEIKLLGLVDNRIIIKRSP